ncbi:MFS transporter [Arthrobacter sp. ov118]|uniref:MFS transporter n=1 Tax=Arthrobacter sp. ov118 TaxID=1761747 RepID=UPI000B87D136
MQKAHDPNTPPPRPCRRPVQGRGFAAATVSFVSVFAAGAAAIPLYYTYRRADGLTNSQFSLVAVAYFVCAVFALLVLGRLSNHHGRRPVSIAALLLAAAGCLTLLWVHSFLPSLSAGPSRGSPPASPPAPSAPTSSTPHPGARGGWSRPPPSAWPSACSSPGCSSSSRRPRASSHFVCSPRSCSVARSPSPPAPRPSPAPPVPGPR